MKVKSRHHLRSDEVREVEEALADGLGVELDADTYERVEFDDSDWDVVLVDDDPLVLYVESEPFLTVQGANAHPPERGVAETPLAERLITALAAGHAEGGDKREELHVQSAALLVRTTEDREMEPYYNDLRADATETPVRDLRETYDLAKEGFEMAVERYDTVGHK